MATSAEKKILSLGEGEVETRPIGFKARLLDAARRQGLPVPPGVLVTDELIRDCYSRYAARLGKKRDSIAPQMRLVREDYLRDQLLQALPHLFEERYWRKLYGEYSKRIAIRSAFSLEDNVQGANLGGIFRTELNVDANSAIQILESIKKILSSAHDFDPMSLPEADGAAANLANFRRDILIMPMTPARTSGSAVTERDFEDDRLFWTEETPDSASYKQRKFEEEPLPKLRDREKPDPALAADWRGRVQLLLRDVRACFGEENWEIEWSDDGASAWLLQIRPLARLEARNEIFASANRVDNLPDPPSIFMTDLIRSSADDFFRQYCQYDEALPKNRSLIEVFEGRPMINLSLLLDMLRILGLPARLITAHLGDEQSPDFPASPRRMLRKAGALSRIFVAQRRAPAEARRAATVLLDRCERPGRNFAEVLATLREVYVIFAREMLSLTAAASFPLSLLRRFEVLEEHAGRMRSAGGDLYRALEQLSRVADEDPAIQQSLARGKLPENDHFLREWERFLSQHGARGGHEGDLARPRFHESPRSLLIALASRPQTQPRPRRTLRGVLTYPIWRMAAPALEAREELRRAVMQGMDRLRREMLGLAKGDAFLWMLYLDEVRELDRTGLHPNKAFRAKRRKEFSDRKSYRLPETLRRFAALQEYRVGGKRGALKTGSVHTGLGLVKGEAIGPVWRPADPDDVPPDELLQARIDQGAELILAAPSFDAGWLPALAHVSAVVLEGGGDLSQGATLLRELRIPAVSGLRNLVRDLESGDRLRVDGGAGEAELIARKGRSPAGPAARKTASRKTAARKKQSQQPDEG